MPCSSCHSSQTMRAMPVSGVHGMLWHVCALPCHAMPAQAVQCHATANSASHSPRHAEPTTSTKGRTRTAAWRTVFFQQDDSGAAGPLHLPNQVGVDSVAIQRCPQPATNKTGAGSRWLTCSYFYERACHISPPPAQLLPLHVQMQQSLRHAMMAALPWSAGDAMLSCPSLMPQTDQIPSLSNEAPCCCLAMKHAIR